MNTVVRIAPEAGKAATEHGERPLTERVRALEQDMSALGQELKRTVAEAHAAESRAAKAEIALREIASERNDIARHFDATMAERDEMRRQAAEARREAEIARAQESEIARRLAETTARFEARNRVLNDELSRAMTEIAGHRGRARSGFGLLAVTLIALAALGVGLLVGAAAMQSHGEKRIEQAETLAETLTRQLEAILKEQEAPAR